MIGDLLKPKTFQFFAQYLLAGYVVIIARSRFVAGLRPKPAELIIEAVIFSLWVQMIVLCGAAIVGLIGVTAMLEARFGADWLDGDVSFLVQVLVVPAVFGAALGYNLSAGWKHALLRRLSLPVTHPVETVTITSSATSLNPASCSSHISTERSLQASSGKSHLRQAIRIDATYISSIFMPSVKTETSGKPLSSGLPWLAWIKCEA